MKKFLYILAICLSFQAYAQRTLSKDYNFTVSAPYRVFDAAHKYYFSKGGQTMALKVGGKEIMIQKFDNNKPGFLKEQSYENIFPKNYGVEDALEVNGKYYLFFSSWDGDNDKEQLFSQEINFDSGEFAGKPKLMFQVNGKVTRNANNDPGKRTNWSLGIIGAGGNKFTVYASQDKKKILVEYRRKPEVKNDKKSYDIIGLGAFDENVQKVSLKEVVMPYTERRMDNLDYKLNNKGDLFLLTKVYHDDSNDDKKKKKDTIANYHIELFTIKAGTDKIDISQFDNGDKFINGIWFFDTDKDYLLVGGFYSNGMGKTRGGTRGGWGANKISPTGESDGIMVFKFKSDGVMYDKNFHDIPVDLINAFASNSAKKKNAKKEEKGISAKIPDLVLKNIEILSDGSMMLIGEQYYMQEHTRNSGGGMGMGGFGGNVYYTYHYGDILATKIASDGTLSFMKKIPKRQSGAAGLGGMSFKYFFANSSHYFVFLDNVKNIDLPEEKIPAIHSDGKGGYLTSVKIADADGALTKGSILNAKEVDDFKIYQFSTSRIVKTSENTFMFEAYKKSKEDIMIKVDLLK